jgi:H+/Cl- antiporter ClcA
MPDRTTSADGPNVCTAGEMAPALWQVACIALIAIIFTAAYLSVYGLLFSAIWLDNEFVRANRWTIPAGVLIFSLLVGLCHKYLNAPTVIHGGFVESMKGEGEKSDYRTFPGALLSSIFSLLSGASIGPEGTIAVLIGDISCFVREKLRIAIGSTGSELGFDVAALASAFNGIVGNVLFTGVFATELQVGGKTGALKLLSWNLLAGTIGFLFYLLLGLPSFARSIPFAPISEPHSAYLLYAILLGLLGGLLAIFAGLSMQGAGRFMDRTFKDNGMMRIVAAALVIAAICYVIPDLLFSGETQIHSIIANAAEIGVTTLLLMAVLKILLLAVSFKSGYIGGPLFPILFSSTMIALALSLIFPGIPLSILVLCIEAGALALALGAPLTAILLVAVVGTADQYMIVLLVISAITAVILSEEAKRIMARNGRTTEASQR